MVRVLDWRVGDQYGRRSNSPATAEMSEDLIRQIRQFLGELVYRVMKQ